RCTTWPASPTSARTCFHRSADALSSPRRPMAEPEHPRPFLHLPRPAPFLIRLALIVGSVAAMGGAFALAFIPAAKGIGVAAQRFEQSVLCKGTEDLQFPRFPERSTVYASNGSVLANIFLDENRI